MKRATIELHFGLPVKRTRARARAFWRHPPDAHGGRPRITSNRRRPKPCARCCCRWSAIRGWCWRGSRGSWCDLNASNDGHAATRERLALETREVFAPLANRLGLWQLKWELEDLAFRFLEPDDYRRIAAALDEKRADRERYITSCAARSSRCCTAPASTAKSTDARSTSTASTGRWSASSCVRAGVRPARGAHRHGAPCRTATRRSAWCMGGGPTSPASSTTTSPRRRTISIAPSTRPCSGREGKAVEVQIRTREMHEQAELGLAAHWRYKEARRARRAYDRKIEWVRRLLEPRSRRRRDATSSSAVRAELFEDRVYALTPKGPRDWDRRPRRRKGGSDRECAG